MSLSPIGEALHPNSERRLKFGFSTLGCPDYGPLQIRALAASFRSAFIEIRTLGGELDFVTELGRYPGGSSAVRNFFRETNLQVCLMGSSFRLTQESDDARATLELEAEAGEALGARWLRVFGGGKWGDSMLEAEAITARCHREWWQELRARRGWGIDLVLETHDAFISAAKILECFARTGGPMPILWDTHHTWKIAAESPAHTFSRLGDHICHVHINDSISVPSDNLPYTYVPPGLGECPISAILALLNNAHFPGVVSLEWQRKWHPSLAPIETVLPVWNALIGSYRDAGENVELP